jgi:radical SAM protein with 4Fe4S-binding SPASM domain
MTRKKQSMDMKTFEKVISDYSEMGGGIFILSPISGDVFLDKKLVERFHVIDKYPLVGPVLIVTNGTMSDRFDDNQLKILLPKAYYRFSIYGVTREEHHQITLRNEYDRCIASLIRIFSLALEIDPDRRFHLVLNTKLIKSKEEVDAWLANTFGDKFKGKLFAGIQGLLANWGGAISSDMTPELAGKMRPEVKNTTNCVLPLYDIRILSSGNVTACGCADFDNTEQLNLGNIKDHSLRELFNSKKMKNMFEPMTYERNPEVCKTCTFHDPLSDIHVRKDLQRKYQAAIECIGTTDKEIKKAGFSKMLHPGTV